MKIEFMAFSCALSVILAHSGMHHAAYASVLSSLSTPDLQRTFCIAPDPLCPAPPATAPYSFEPVCPFTASAPTHGEYALVYLKEQGKKLIKMIYYSL